MSAAPTVTYYKCDGCQKPILKPEEGLVVHGNIYVADPEKVGGLIGNNFPDDKPKFTTDDVMQTAYCVPCFLRACLPKAKLTSIR